MTTPDKLREQAEFFVENKSTLRGTAKKFGISKSTIHNNFRNKLYNVDEALYNEVIALLQKNKSESTLRGGLAMKEIFRKRRESKTKI